MSYRQTEHAPAGRPPIFPTGGGRPPARAKPLLWAVVLGLMVLWSLLAWFAYGVTDPLLSWLAGSASGLVQSGQGVAEAWGGKAAGETLRAVDANGFVGQILAFAAVVAKPAIAVVWGLGMLGLLLIPATASVVGRFLGRRSS